MNKITFSPLFKKWCKDHNQSEALIYLLQCALISESDETLSLLFESLRGDEYELVMRILIGSEDDSGYSLRNTVPWFFSEEVVEKKEKSKFNDYIQLLLDKGLNSKGSLNNQCSYLVIKKDKPTKEAFESLCLRIKDLDINKLADVTVKYYAEGEYKTNLTKYLESGAEVDLALYKAEEVIKPKYKGLR